MPGRPIHALAILVSLLLAGCNTDGMTPQAEIPDSQTTSTQTTSTQATETSPLEDQKPVETAEVPQEQQPLIDSEPLATDERAPQNTLEAQAAAIEQGQDNPSMTKPRDGNLGANLYRSDSQKQQVSSIYTANTAKSTIRFLPIIGAPVQAVTPLSKELGASARGSGLTIKSSGDQTAEHVLKGYLSAFADGDKITVVYVWDVLDNAGARLHRIQGQQSVKGSGSDAWAAVPPEVMREIGAATIAEYVRWRQSQS